MLGCAAHHSRNMRLASRCGEGKLTNALPASFSHFRVLSSNVATAHPGHSTATERLEGLMARDSRALSSPSSAAVIEGGIRIALAASARLARRPSLLGDIIIVVYCIWVVEKGKCEAARVVEGQL